MTQQDRSRIYAGLFPKLDKLWEKKQGFTTEEDEFTLTKIHFQECGQTPRDEVIKMVIQEWREEARKPKPVETPSAIGTVSILSLSQKLDQHAKIVLARDYLKPLPREKGKAQKYDLLQQLPTKEEYLRLKEKYFTVSVQGLIEDAYGEFSSLAEELQDWYDNLPEQFQDGEKGEQLQEAIDQLQTVDLPDLNYELLDKLSQVTYIPAVDLASRQKRFDDAIGRLEAAYEELTEVTEDDGDEELLDYCQELASEIEEAKDLQVEFPGGFGS